MNKQDKLFIGEEIMKAVDNGVKILLPYQRSMDRCRGWFCHDPLELIVTTRHSNEDFLGTFIHESCHLDQFLEQTYLWTDPMINMEEGDVLMEYLCGLRKNKTTSIIKYTKALLKLEIDCEKRSLEKIVSRKLSLSTENYAKRANVYLYSYRYFLDLRCWYHRVKKPYHDEEILASMPTELLTFDKYWKGHKLLEKFLLENREIMS